MQAIGTHNSYHVTPDNAIIKLLTRSSVKALLGPVGSTEIPSSWEATQAELATQIRDYGAWRSRLPSLLKSQRPACQQP